MLIRAYGLFWRADEIEWFPGSGNHKGFQLLGKQGRGSTLRVTDFRTQNGIYILYGNYGAYYVGLTDNLGSRLKDHQKNHRSGQWDRFSWFGFANVQQQRDPNTGLQNVKKLKATVGTPKQAIADLEALLIHAIGPSNTRKMNFERADEWKQVALSDRARVLGKVMPGRN